MYIIYVNNKPIFLTDKICSDTKYEFYNYSEIQIEEVLYKLKNTTVFGFCLFHNNLEKIWQNFKTNFVVVEAAGGLVSKEEQLLLIYRNSIWDIPKGKVERGESIEETALREVEEECGITNLQIMEQLPTTYHIFHENKKTKLKVTHWFSMSTSADIKPVPQEEEGIAKASYIDRAKIPKLYDQMYNNIKELLITFLNNK